jgi:hypothetical protein
MNYLQLLKFNVMSFSIPFLPPNMGIPVGSVTAFAGYIGPPMSTPPSSEDYYTTPPPNLEKNPNHSPPQTFGIGTVELQGWMVCDGRKLYCRDYPSLFLTIGFLYNQQSDTYKPGQPIPDKSDPDATFRIPDYRGYFLRMVSGQEPWINGSKNNPDPDADKRYLAYGTGTLSDGVGSIQEDALQTHEHGYYKADSAPVVANPGTPASTIPPPPAKENALTTEPTDDVNNPPGKIRISEETRAKNMYVYYLIKYA